MDEPYSIHVQEFTHDRHCALCLKLLPAGKIMVCGGCKRRAYCSLDCRNNDWYAARNGQGHVNWCDLECGEEDLDWVVTRVPRKGFGLIVKRNIPAKFRILVDSTRSYDHPGINDLEPEGGNLLDKMWCNCIGLGLFNKSLLCMRVARVNHTCEANAGHLYDDMLQVKILFAERDIAAGEEICVNYEPFNELGWDPDDPNRPRWYFEYKLYIKWGIFCNVSNCFCRRPDILWNVQVAKQLFLDIKIMGSNGKYFEAMNAIKELIELHDLINSSWVEKLETFYSAYQVSMVRRDTMGQGEEFLRKAYEIQCAISSPNSRRALKLKRLLEHPPKYPNSTRVVSEWKYTYKKEFDYLNP